MADKFRTAFIVGAGSGLSASLARLLHAEGLQIALGARNPAKLEPLAAEIGALPVSTDAASPASVAAAFQLVESRLGSPDVVIYNASGRLRGAFVDLDAAAVRATLEVTAYGGFLVAQQAARRMLPRSSGAILFTGASASIKGYAQSAPFAMGKFALRGLAQSLARELAPRCIHVAHFVIDGGIRSASRPVPADAPDSLLDPDAIAQTYLHVLRQDRSAWTWEIELRPWGERF
ncbi:MAG: SDR family NAD(P)-dependent oxidoreductase [Steroidobacteraceae bacterium]